MSDSDQYYGYYIDDFITEDYLEKDLYFEGDYFAPGYYEGEQVTVIVETGAVLTTAFAVVADLEVLDIEPATFSSVFSLTANAVEVDQIQAVFNSNFSLTAQGTHVKGADCAIDASFASSSVVGVIYDNIVDISSAFSVVAQGIEVISGLVSEFSLSAQARVDYDLPDSYLLADFALEAQSTGSFNNAITLETFVDVFAFPRVVVPDLFVYRIPQETQFYRIPREFRGANQTGSLDAPLYIIKGRGAFETFASAQGTLTYIVDATSTMPNTVEFEATINLRKFAEIDSFGPFTLEATGSRTRTAESAQDSQADLEALLSRQYFAEMNSVGPFTLTAEGDRFINGDGAFTAQVFIDEADLIPQPMTLEMTAFIDNDTVQFEYTNYFETTDIHWGDGVVETYPIGANQVITHTYATAGDYVVELRHNSKCFFFRPDEHLIRCPKFPNKGLANLVRTFAGATNLLEVADVPHTGNTNCYATFQNCEKFNSPLSNLDTSLVTAFGSMFQNAQSFNQDLSSWDTSSVTNTLNMFSDAYSFNGDITTWDMSGVGDARLMFRNCFAFNQPIGVWNTDSMSSTISMFDGASSFNQPLDNWNVSNVNNMVQMFRNASSFNQPLNSWNVGNVSNMERMFGAQNASMTFDQDLSNWNTSKVTNMSNMFSAFNGENAFNGDITTWDTSSVTRMNAMFYNAKQFNQDLSNWDTSAVTTMVQMFTGTTSFNGDITTWDTGSVTDMTQMFFFATAFNQDLSNWCVELIPNPPSLFDASATSWVLPRPVWGTCPGNAYILPGYIADTYFEET